MCALICLQFLWKALTFLWYTSPPTCLLPTPCTIQLSDSRSLPTGDAFADGDFHLLVCRWLLSWFLVMSELTPLSNVLLSNWVSGAQSQPVWILRWVGPRPFASRGAAISCGYFCLVCLEPMEHNHFGCYARGLRDFFGLQKIVIFQFFGYLPRIATLLCTLRCGVSHLNWCLCLG